MAELIDTCVEPRDRHRRIEAVLADLPDLFTTVRAALNELHRILREPT